MKLREKNNIISIKTDENQYIGFHCENLEVASLDKNAWQAMIKSHDTANGPVSEALTEINAWSHSKNPKTQDAYSEEKVQSLTINVTQLCNLNCSYCAADGNGTYGDPVAQINIEQTLPQLKYFLNQLNDEDSFHIHFLGGEPLLYPQAIRAISEYAQLFTAGKSIPLKFSITTNGTLLNQKNIDLLKKIKAHVQVSLDGPPEINDVQRHKEKSSITTSTVISGLNKLTQERASLGSLGISAVFNENNMDVVKCYIFLETLQTDWLELTFSFTDKSSKMSKEFSSQMKEVAALAYKKNGLKGLKKIRTFHSILNNIDQRTRIKNYCGAGKDFLMIDARNQIYTCPWDVGKTEEKIGQSTKIDQKKLNPYKENLVKKLPCQTCWARFLCGGGCMFTHKMATGDKKQVDQDFCNRTKDLISTAIVYYEKEGRKNHETH